MKRDHSKLICDIGEITSLFTETSNLDGLLQNITEMIAFHMEADVCSIYLFDEQDNELVLRATKGLAASSVGTVRLKPGDGLTGVAFQELRAVCEGDVSRNPKFRYFSGIGEERFASFVAAPIVRGQTRIGVMTLQSEKRHYFTTEDVNIFRAITSQLATTIEMAKFLISAGRSEKTEISALEPALKFIKGRAGAEGFAYGEAVVMTVPSWEEFSGEKISLPMTLADLREAAVRTEKELEALQRQIEEKLFDVASLIFSAQILMLKDRAFLGAMEELVVKGMHPVDAVCMVVRQYAGRFARMSNEYIREKQYDVMDVGRRLLDNLAGRDDRKDDLSGKVVVARALLPSEALKLASCRVSGIILLSGGVTSHVAVLARSLGIPLVIADMPRLLGLAAGIQVLVDGNMGNIYIAPEADVVAKFRAKEELKAAAAQARDVVRPETFTLDGTRMTLLANINLLGDAPLARAYQAEGVGLYRTEFPFIIRSDFPAEEEQYVIYRRLVEMMDGRELTFRTLDIGGDKMLSYYDHSREANPFLGLRSVRFSLRHKDIFACQLRAILRAGAGRAPREVRIMFPMISSPDEFREARAVVDACAAELASAGIAHQEQPLIGMMVEIPSALDVLDELACEVDFFSIGTNDLIQYILAVDRTNEKVADLYIPHHPSVLRALNRVAAAAARHGRDLSICGDMAHAPRYIPFLAGIGVRKLSIDARYIPKVQARLLALDIGKARAHAQEILSMTSIRHIEQALRAMEDMYAKA
ncbi:MAG: phosphoenolpyruvate--protein phosphotransferase [Candidatus Omnitrophota bacterium]